MSVESRLAHLARTKASLLQDWVEAVERDHADGAMEAYRTIANECGEYEAGKVVKPTGEQIRRAWERVRQHSDLVGVAEVARIAGLSESSIRTYVRRGTIPDAIPVAGSDALVWDRSAIKEWARNRPSPGRPLRQNTEVPR